MPSQSATIRPDAYADGGKGLTSPNCERLNGLYGIDSDGILWPYFPHMVRPEYVRPAASPIYGSPKYRGMTWREFITNGEFLVGYYH